MCERDEKKKEVERGGRSARWSSTKTKKEKGGTTPTSIFSPALPSPFSPSSFLATSVALAQYSASYSSKSAVDGSPDDIVSVVRKNERDAAVSTFFWLMGPA